MQAIDKSETMPLMQIKSFNNAQSCKKICFSTCSIDQIVNPETVCLHEIAQSCIGFAAEDHRLKKKYRTHLACAKKRLKSSTKYIDSSLSDHVRMEVECVKKVEDEKLQELETEAKDRLEIVKGAGSN